VRDIETDRRAGKRTLAVRLGRARAVNVFATMLVLAFVSVGLTAILGDLDAWILLALLAMPLAVPLARTLGARRDGPSLNKLLADTGRLLAIFSILLSAGLLLSS
jgi:1,4-dihydroxy-2-naphthoate octaprenyltransferase